MNLPMNPFRVAWACQFLRPLKPPRRATVAETKQRVSSSCRNNQSADHFRVRRRFLFTIVFFFPSSAPRESFFTVVQSSLGPRKQPLIDKDLELALLLVRKPPRTDRLSDQALALLRVSRRWEVCHWRGPRPEPGCRRDS